MPSSSTRLGSTLGSCVTSHGPSAGAMLLADANSTRFWVAQLQASAERAELNANTGTSSRTANFWLTRQC